MDIFESSKIPLIILWIILIIVEIGIFSVFHSTSWTYFFKFIAVYKFHSRIINAEIAFQIKSSTTEMTFFSYNFFVFS